jgi:hypothetical protein
LSSSIIHHNQISSLSLSLTSSHLILASCFVLHILPQTLSSPVASSLFFIISLHLIISARMQQWQ